MRAANSGLVANPTEAGTSASRQRAESWIQLLGRYSSRSSKLCQMAAGIREEHAQLAVLDAPSRAAILPLTAPYKYPREIEFVESLPKTISGKIRRVEL